MKKLIQIGSLLSLLVLFTTIPTFAQGFGTDVNIPFAFTVADRTYEAGNYIVKLDPLGTGNATLSIRDTKTDEVQRVLLNVNGEAATGQINLVFEKIDGQRFLTKVTTPNQSYAIVKSKSEKNASRAREKAEMGGGANLF